MKKVIAVLLSIILIFSLTACNSGKNVEEPTFKTYQKINYEDFNKFMTEKGHSPVENTDNSQVDFERSFGVTIDDNLSILFFELNDADMSYRYFKHLLQTFETFYSDFSSMERYENNGCYVLTDGYNFTYLSYVDNTVIHALIIAETEEEFVKYQNQLIDYVDALDYPMLDIPDVQ